MTDNLQSIERKVQPIAQMSETVKICKDNINIALDQINKVTSNISEQEDVVDILIEKRSMINSEFDVYLNSMRRAMELIKYFEVELVYFKDSFNIADKLKQALKIAAEECDKYLELNIKKLLDQSSKKHIKRFKELLKVLEVTTSEADFKKYLKIYVEQRRATFKNRLGSSIEKQVEVNLLQDRMSMMGGASSQCYERGSHPLITQVTEMSTCIEEELIFGTSIFEGPSGLGGYSALSLAVKVCEKLISRLASMLTQSESELSKLLASYEEQQDVDSIISTLKPFSVILDMMETMHERMPKSLMQLIKVKELPLKKAVEGILFKSQQMILTVAYNSQEMDDEQEVDYTAPLPRIASLVTLVSDVLALYPKSFRMIDFVNKQIKDEPKRFNKCVQIVETRRELYKKKYSLKFQFVLNNYGFMYSHLGDSQLILTLFNLDTEESIIQQIKSSLDVHCEQFSQYVWKDVRNVVKRMFGSDIPNIAEFEDELHAKIDQTLRKDFKKYHISKDIGMSAKLQLKDCMLQTLAPAYKKYLKAVKNKPPANAYSLEDIEISVEKLLKIA